MLLSEEQLKLGTRNEAEQGTIGISFFVLEVLMGKKYSHVPVLFSSWRNV
jgi:hypothetical protein